jgi:NAD(P)-dependent dehydrogenase (short-subunit alcohol dehydrogenase family)
MSKSIVVIGATGTVGWGTVEQLLRSGYHAIAVGRNLDKLQSLARRFQDLGRLDVVVGSIESESTAAALVAQIRPLAPELAGVVVSVNAPAQEMLLADVDSSELLQVLQTNLVTHLIAAKSFISILPAGGTYLAIGGGMADLVVRGMGVLSICQAAQRAMLRGLAAEMGDRGVRIHELMLYSMIAGESSRASAHPKSLTDEDVGRHVVTVLNNPDWFPEAIISLKSRKEVGLQPVVAPIRA